MYSHFIAIASNLWNSLFTKNEISFSDLWKCFPKVAYRYFSITVQGIFFLSLTMYCKAEINFQDFLSCNIADFLVGEFCVEVSSTCAILMYIFFGFKKMLARVFLHLLQQGWEIFSKSLLFDHHTPPKTYIHCHLRWSGSVRGNVYFS